MTDVLDQLLAGAPAAAPPAPHLQPAEQHAIATLDRAGLDPVVIEYAVGTRRNTVTVDPPAPEQPARAEPAALPVFIPRPDDDVEPPSMLPGIQALLRDFDESRPRSQQKRPGPSELGTPCGRQLAYKIAQYKGAQIAEPNDRGLKWAALQGTMMHRLMEEVLEWENGRRAGEPGFDPWDVEAEAVIDDNIRGSSDAHQRVTVVDWKYTGKSKLDKLRSAKRRGLPPKEQITQEYRVQTHLYGLARELRGLPVKWVRIILLARSYDFTESEEWTERYDPRIAAWAVNRYYRLDELVDELNLAEHPERWVEVPSSPSGDACHFCPFKRPGGDADDTGCPGDTGDSRARFEKSIGAA